MLEMDTYTFQTKHGYENILSLLRAQKHTHTRAYFPGKSLTNTVTLFTNNRIFVKIVCPVDARWTRACAGTVKRIIISHAQQYLTVPHWELGQGNSHSDSTFTASANRFVCMLHIETTKTHTHTCFVSSTFMYTLQSGSTYQMNPIQESGFIGNSSKHMSRKH